MSRKTDMEELKKQVNEVRFSRMDYLYGEDIFDISKGEDKATVKIESMINYVSEEYCISLDEWYAFIDKLYDRLHIDKWKRNYRPDKCIFLDGTFWDLKISFDGRRKRVYKGDNTFPANWNKFASLMEKFGKKAKNE